MRKAIGWVLFAVGIVTAAWKFGLIDKVKDMFNKK
jgi:hypothetical protein